MDIGEYQAAAMRTANTQLSTREALIEAVLGLSGESGEVADLLKKHLAQGHPLDREKLLEEAGDIAWYLARLCAALGEPMEDVLAANIRKLERRYPDGFSTAHSRARVDARVEGE